MTFDKREYMREYRRRYYRRPDVRAKLLVQSQVRREQLRSAAATMKLDQGCIDCGYNEDPVALDFDHVQGKKLFGVSAVISHAPSIERFLAEVDKCEVVCANCHRIRTMDRKRGR